MADQSLNEHRTLRARTLMLGISLTGVDNAAITAGRQNVTFAFNGNNVRQRIDKVVSLGRTYELRSGQPLILAKISQLDGHLGEPISVLWTSH